MKEVNSHIILAIYGDSDIVRALDSDNCDGDENPISPVAKAFDAARLNRAMGKAASIEGWDTELGDVPPQRTSPPAKPFAKSSEERFKKVSETIRTIFGPERMEEAEEAIELAKTIRDEARAEVIGCA